MSSNSAFYQGLFSSESVLGTFLNTKNAEFSFPGGLTTFSGIEVDSSHIVMEEAGFFKADATGIHRFDLTNIDDGAMVFIGGAAYDCCSGSLSGGDAEPFLFGVKKSNDDSNPILKSWVYLEAGLVYPFKIVYFNGISAGSMLLNVTPPDGFTVDIANYIYQVENVGQKNCIPEVIQTSFVTSTKWVFSSNVQQVTKRSSLVTTNGSTYIETEIVYGVIRTSTVTTNWTGTTTSYTTRTVFVTDGYEYVREEVEVYRPPASTVTRFNRVQGTVTVTNTYTNIIYVDLPIPSTTVIVGKEPFTTTVEVVIDNTTTRVVSVGVTDLPVTTVYPKTFVTSRATSRIGSTWYEVIYENLSTSYITVDLSVGTTYPVTTTISNDQTTITSTYIVVETIAPISKSTSYYTGVESVDKTFVATLTSAGKTYGYYSYVYYIPFLKTSITTGTIATTITIKGAYTTYVQIITNAPTVITYDPTIVQKTQRYVTTVVGTSTGYVVEEIYPPPVVIPIEYTGSTTSISTRWITNGIGSTVAWDEIRYVPALSTSYSFWTDTYATTKYITSVFSYGPDLYSTTTIRFIERPPPGKTTDFWTGTNTTTTYSTTTFPGNNNIPVTDIIQIILVPNPTIVIDGCSKQVHTITCTGNTSIFTIGDEFATVTGTTCEMPDYISGSFLATTTTSTVIVGKVTSEIAHVNVVDPTVICFTTTPVLDCNSKTVIATCEYGTTLVSKEGVGELAVGTTSCTVPSGISGSFAESVTTVTRSGTMVTVTNAIVPSFPCEPSLTMTTFTTCKSLTISASCSVFEKYVKIGFKKKTLVLSEFSCQMPQGVTGSFKASTSITKYLDKKITTTFTITNINDPVVDCKTSSKFVPSSHASESLSFTKPIMVSSSKTHQTLTFSSSSSSLFLSSFSVTKSLPASSLSSQLTPNTSRMSQSMSSSSTVSHSSLASLPSFQSSSIPPVITRTTVNTVCEFTTTTLTNDTTILTEVVLTPANSCMTKFITTTLTVDNHESCTSMTTTSINTMVGNDEISTIEVCMIILTPKPECFETSTITTIANSVCSLETNVWTSTVQENNITVSIIDQTIKTPPATCNIFYTEYPAIDCGTTTEISFIATTNWEGKYVNGTLIIVETPNESLCSLTSSSEILSSDDTQTGGSTAHMTSYTTLTITSCSDNHCYISEVPATTETTTSTVSNPGDKSIVSTDAGTTSKTDDGSTETTATDRPITEPTQSSNDHPGTEPTQSNNDHSITEPAQPTNDHPGTEPTQSNNDHSITEPAQPTNDHPGTEPTQSSNDHPITEPTQSSNDHPGTEPVQPTTVAATTKPTKSTTTLPNVPIFETNIEGGAPVEKVTFRMTLLAIMLSVLIL
ncbi:hypothetical protein CANINC_001641 [Pichia inconspicua]|uniref:PA14 domain-containing protein n=1 Tax=Pichia inconspicua TaxID=52247 RepID=A0A4T0X4A8_9ASCO|nr:hypothetical protein CANINC_001641 [[Candida] inconspicua]